MKKLFSLFLSLALALASVPQPAQAQQGMLSPSQIKPTWGFIRKGPCGAVDGYNCGSNPPTYHITPDQCGILFSTSNARNSGGAVDFSTRGIRFTLPTVAELIAAGYNPGGVSPTERRNRQGQCEIHFVMGAPGPENYLRIGIDGVQGTDKVTFFGQGAYDLYSGDLVFPYRTPGVITVIWNGTSWLLGAASPAIAERMQNGQLAANGQGRLFLVTADPTWWTVDTMVGKLAYCPLNGLGTVANANGGSQLTLTPSNCTFRAAGVGTGTDYVGYRNYVSGIINGLTAGAAYASGTAPNGEAYAAGNYVILTVTSTTGFDSGTTIEVHNVPSTLGSKAEGKWIGKLISSTQIELHEEVRDETELVATPIGPPSNFVAGDSLNAPPGWPGFNFAMLTAPAIGGGRITNLSTGTEYSLSGSNRDTVVGMVRRVSGTGYQDTLTNRLVASWFNPVEKKCLTAPTVDRTVTSTTFVEVHSEMRCNFVYLSGSSAKATSLGDTGRRVRFVANIGAGNGTAGSGCKFTVGFDSATAETEIAGFVNPSGVSGGRQTVTVTGTKIGLTETNHYVTLLARSVTGGTCTINAATTQLSAFVWQ